VLAISIDLNHLGVTVRLGVFETSAHRSTDAHIEGELQNRGAGALCHRCSVVARTVVDNQDVARRPESEDLADRAADGLGLIPRWHDDQNIVAANSAHG
jgi:hypothetical protein